MADIIAPPTDQPTSATPAPAPQPAEQGGRRERAQVHHTPGGVPAAPLALLTANTAVAGTAATAMVGGPLLALLTALGTLTMFTAGRARNRRTDRRGRGNGPRPTGHRAGGLLPRQRSRSSAGSFGMAGGQRGQRSRGRGMVDPRTGRPLPQRGRGTVGQVRSLRDAHRAAHPSRSARRQQRTADQHRIADARRLAQRQTRQQQRGTTGRGPRLLGRRGAAASPKAQARKDARLARKDTARLAKRAGQRQASSQKVTAKRRELRNAPARREARMRLFRSASRYQARRLGNVLLALPVMLLGTLTTMAGRKLGFPSWMYPGHRLLRWLNAKALTAHRGRDTQIRCDWAEKEAALAEAEKNGATPAPSGPARAVARAPLSHNANTNLGVVLTTPAGFNFADAAADMEAQAQSFDPDGMMQVLAAFDALPEAMHSVARTFQILAERCDAEFPLDKRVGESLNDVFALLQQTISACEEVATTMRQSHETEIRRLEDPRNGEDKWDTTNN